MRIKGSALWVIVAVFLSCAGGVALAEDAVGTASASGAAGTEQPGQKPPSPEEMQQMMQAMLTPMGDMMRMMLSGMAEAMAEPKFAGDLASFTRNYYDALITRGFTEEEAMRIVTSTGIPSMGGK